MSRTIVPRFGLAGDGYRTFLSNSADLFHLIGLPWTYANLHSFFTTLPEESEIGTGSWIGKFAQIVLHRAHKRANIREYIEYFTHYMWAQPVEDRLLLEHVLIDLREKEEN